MGWDGEAGSTDFWDMGKVGALQERGGLEQVCSAHQCVHGAVTVLAWGLEFGLRVNMHEAALFYKERSFSDSKNNYHHILLYADVWRSTLNRIIVS